MDRVLSTVVVMRRRFEGEKVEWLYSLLDDIDGYVNDDFVVVCGEIGVVLNELELRVCGEVQSDLVDFGLKGLDRCSCFVG